MIVMLRFVEPAKRSAGSWSAWFHLLCTAIGYLMAGKGVQSVKAELTSNAYEQTWVEGPCLRFEG